MSARPPWIDGARGQQGGGTQADERWRARLAWGVAAGAACPGSGGGESGATAAAFASAGAGSCAAASGAHKQIEHSPPPLPHPLSRFNPRSSLSTAMSGGAACRAQRRWVGVLKWLQKPSPPPADRAVVMDVQFVYWFGCARDSIFSSDFLYFRYEGGMLIIGLWRGEAA